MPSWTRGDWGLSTSFVAALIGALAIPWPSAATIEAYEMILSTAGADIYALKI